MHAHVLGAETDPGIAALLAKGLRRHDLAPTVVTTPEDTLAAAMTGGYAIVLVDLDDERRGTLAVLHELRAAGVTAAVIVMAGRHGLRDRAAALAAGADDYLTAPLRFATLIPLIQNVLARPR